MYNSATLRENSGDLRSIRAKKFTWTFNFEQLLALERAFLWDKYPKTWEKRRLALNNGLSLDAVMTWFNHRRKLYKKRDKEI
ncbi:homeobox protein H40-like [Phlebotomus argentipes]|uniref:homeobox protein H40-like n=1 Tax=Phlebotomus argentipes TaxID=94469 RepID=UPI002893508D|nr:homeobox protein H40-like [Phlebotomus argentipes]